MSVLLQTLRLLSIVVWVGGLVFFAFVLAPVAFHVLPSTRLAGLVVAGTLGVLHRIGLVSGAVFAIITALQSGSYAGRAKRIFHLELFLTFAMLLATLYLQMRVIPSMEQDRARAGGDLQALALTDPARLHFDELHKRSERFEGAVLFCGVATVILLAAELSVSRSRA